MTQEFLRPKSRENEKTENVEMRKYAMLTKNIEIRYQFV